MHGSKRHTAWSGMEIGFDGPFSDGGRGRAKGRGRGRYGFGPGWHGGFGPGFPGPVFGRGAKVGRGDVRAAVLALLAEEPMHGYQIITELTERSGGVWRPSPGSVYPTLQVLEDQGLVTADRTEGRRVFSLTEEGRTVADAAEGPAPWEDVAGGAPRSQVQLRRLIGEVAAAAAQVGMTGDERQLAAAGELLTETRRRLYFLLAEGPSTDDPTPTEHEGGAG